MSSIKLCTGGILCVFSFWALTTFSAANKMNQAANTLTINTNRYQVIIKGGVLTGITNRLTGEKYTIPNLSPPSDAGLYTWNGKKEKTLWAKKAKKVVIKQKGKNQYEIKIILRNSSYIILKISVDSVTRDLIIRQTGRVNKGGISGIQWGIANLSDNRVRLILPVWQGVEVKKGMPSLNNSVSWPDKWQAQLAIIQGKKGGVKIWSEDTECHFKRLHYGYNNGVFKLAFESQNEAPFNSRKIKSVVWRLNTYKGNWKTGASSYKRWIKKTFGSSVKQPEWVKDIKLVVTMWLSKNMVKKLAEYVDPKKTLIFTPLWSKEHLKPGGHLDDPWPNPTVGKKFKEFVKFAQSFGFKVMPHLNFSGVSCQNELYKDNYIQNILLKNPYTGKKVGEQFRARAMNPASDRVRQILIENSVRVQKESNCDGLYFDWPAVLTVNNSSVDGKNNLRGANSLLKGLRKRMPEVLFGVEGHYNELFLDISLARVYTAFSMNEKFGSLHSISEFLYGDYRQRFASLGGPRTTVEAKQYLYCKEKIFNRYGLLPSLVNIGVTQCDFSDMASQMVLKEARFWMENNLKPDFDINWKPNTIFAYKTIDDISVICAQKSNGQILYTDTGKGKNLVSRLIKGVKSMPGKKIYIPGWIAYNEKGIIGLNPDTRYVLLPGKPDNKHSRISNIPKGTIIKETRSNDKRLLVKLRSNKRRLSLPTSDIKLHLGTKPVKIFAGNSKVIYKKQKNGSYFYQVKGKIPQAICVILQEPATLGLPHDLINSPYKKTGLLVGGIYDEASIFGNGKKIGAKPLWKGKRIPGLNAATFREKTIIEYIIKLPRKEKILLNFGMGIHPIGAGNGGVRFTIEVDGIQLFERKLKNPIGFVPGKVDLSKYAGDVILLSLVTEPLSLAAEAEDKWFIAGVGPGFLPARWLAPMIIEKKK